jgi:predicted acylesterase/phospholipase RssA
MLRLFVMLGLLCSLIGCGHTRPNPPPGCIAPAYKLLPSPFDPRGMGEVDPAAPMPLGQVLGPLLEAGRSGGLGAQSRVLLLSGGSQHGSFGAGLFKGMPQVSDYEVVTGVSTGALQSTFVFLANRPVPADRAYPEYMRSQGSFGSPGQSSLTDLALAYRIEAEGDLLKVGRLGLAGALFSGSAADFGPLRRALLGLISPDTVRAIAGEGDAGRKLLVGVADLDDGYGYAIDLTMLAQQAVAQQNIEAARHCYVEALIASSSVPPGVPPVSLNIGVIRSDGQLDLPRTDMFMDGGARYGVFFSQLHDSVASDGGSDLDLVVNGFLYGKPWTDKEGERVGKWNAVSLALRAVDLMENQVYRLSIGEAQRWAVDHGSLRMAFISNEDLQHVTTPPLDWRYNGQTCTAWKAADRETFKPMEFYPNYMKCIVDYGQHRGAEDPWNRVVGPVLPIGGQVE